MLLVLAALAASIVAMLVSPQRVVPIVAVAASAIEVVIRLGIVSLHVVHVPLGIVLGAALVVAGALIWAKAGTKTLASAATVIALVGAVQLLVALAPARMV